MGIGIAIAGAAIGATASNDIAFGAVASKQKKELEKAIKDAETEIKSAQDLYQKCIKSSRIV